MRRNAHSQSSNLQLADQGDDQDCINASSGASAIASSPSQILDRVQSDRVTVTKPEEDRRRRTIIVEKKNDSFGFTLQSYGIHYKREKEIEMITYVDSVDYDGPAYKAGMREGDVILSINGTDMERADHKTLVNYIKNCESRMRMVVLFEDCVRKVELHMKYIQLQRLLQAKMDELDRLCIRERNLLEGKWKTHSLPARKKASSSISAASGGEVMGSGGGATTPTQPPYGTYCRPTVSTEDVAKVARQHETKHVQQPPLVFAYQYMDTHYRYMIHPVSSSSGEYLLSFEPPRYKEQGHTSKPPTEKQSRGNQTTRNTTTSEKPKKTHGPYYNYAGQLCNPCLQVSNNGDNTSLDAYDLASPCCDPRCVPSSRRRSRSHKDPNKKRDSKTEETQTDPQQTRNRNTSHSQQNTAQHSSQRETVQSYSAPRRYFQIGAGLVSQCSLHSCTSSEISNVVPTTMGESSVNSYTTSLSTDTLYWDGSCDNSRQLSLKSNKHDQHQHHQRYSSTSSSQHQDQPIYVQYGQVKPKSWDNLTTKAIGGYGFGYGYLDTTAKKTKSQGTQYVRSDSKPSGGGSSSGSSTQTHYTQHVHRSSL
ncbi:unnamed protein product [Acanthoscelides obtectus]|uniref:PDZ domain-containing protein n=1 Tax=Acanthoscelides obtectus TaxID=200917 RepID=A0A9P0L9W7_ACAOB|nr:unnamed protein product [Acanthoscelides obtectus]CAK1638890.1 General receptor for phosphoinositides 1-associated scaffold protein [Acanthoscelides obtectus]